MNTGVGSTTVVPNDLVSENKVTNDASYSQNSVGRDIAAEFDSLFSPEILLKLDNDPQLKGGPCGDALPVTTSPTVEKSSVAKPTNASATSTITPLPPGSLTDAHTRGVSSSETERPLSSERTKGNEDGLMHGLFGGVASEDYSKCRSERTPTRDLPRRARAGQSGRVDENLEEEDVGLQRAMERVDESSHRATWNFYNEWVCRKKISLGWLWSSACKSNVWKMVLWTTIIQGPAGQTLPHLIPSDHDVQTGGYSQPYWKSIFRRALH
ncbi:hypothetical protein GBAR_LOCUS9374 [Geodia barretti]|uniref:Uncharacterized protein n=1 Tax=Geodia barretti TaxID=519541 RepID=A0AA35RNY4_GEOBA|nr:hypothetical protein GBAR_LOCUS9374 [Geodia barretti]